MPIDQPSPVSPSQENDRSADEPADTVSPEDERNGTTARTIRIFVLSAMLIYAIGVVFSHFVYSADDRAACHSAGGFAGRIWCPDSVDTEGFSVHFVEALGWPVNTIRALVTKAGNSEEAVVESDDGEDVELLKARARASVRETQTLLNMLGYKIGDADGVLGAGTRTAISEFQRRDGMKVSGEITDELVARLKSRARAR